MATIAIIEDDKTLAEMYKFKLEAEGYTCVVAHDGISGLQLLEQKHPALVLMDLMLPHMTGDEILKKLRQTDWGKKIKVLILTNINHLEAPDGLDKAGADGYLIKAEHTPTQIAQIVHSTLKTSK